MISDIIACSHQRCAEYFMESIQSIVGFYGWKCQSYFRYVLGLCPFNQNELLKVGADLESKTRGVRLVKTNSVTPFAKGREGDSFITEI